MFGNESSPLISVMGTEVPGNEGSWERKFLGTKVPVTRMTRTNQMGQLLQRQPTARLRNWCAILNRMNCPLLMT